MSASKPMGGRRPRPCIHFTPPRGWLNDPHAIAYLDGRYHLFYQHNPAATVWQPAIHWAHATSPTLVGWVDHGDVLFPDDQDTGCWSGGIAVDADRATLLYTAATEPDVNQGRVRLAHGSPDHRTWTKDPIGPVIDGPPDGLDTVAFRDPAPWRHGTGWRLVMGTGIAGVGGAAVQYSSPDLRAWSYDGPVLVGDAAEFGTVWECPQLFELDGSWVLLISVWDAGVLRDVRYAVGDYTGTMFSPRSWGRLGHGAASYATTTFLDADGQRCVMSWLREREDTTPTTWAGALSLPYRLGLVDDRLIATVHPDLDVLRHDAQPLTAEPAAREMAGGAVDVVLDYADSARGVHLLITTAVPDESEEAVSIEAVSVELRDGDLDRLEVRAPGHEGLVTSQSVSPGDGRLRLILDGDLVELSCTGTEGVTSFRLPEAPRRVAVRMSWSGGGPAPTGQIHALRNPLPGADIRPEWPGEPRPATLLG